MEQKPLEQKIKKLLLVFAAAALTIVIYIFLHEMGHLIVMVSAGATITDFSILTAHVSAIGGEYTNLSDLWLNANGALLPVVVGFLNMILYNPKNTNAFYRFFTYMLALMPIGSLFAWLFLPIAYVNGNAPAADDVTKFLDNFSRNYHPMLVSLAAMIMVGSGVALMLKKRMFHNFIAEIR